MAPEPHRHLIAKLRCAAALSWPYAGPYAGRGPRRTYGDKGDDATLPIAALTETAVAGHRQPGVSPRHRRPTECGQPLHVVSLATTNRRPHARAPGVLGSSAVALAYAPRMDAYALRCHMEFHFRDAQQYGGLEAFMHPTPTGVSHAAPLSLVMVKVAYRLRPDSQPQGPASSALDWKADCRGSTYVEETIHMRPAKPAPVL